MPAFNAQLACMIRTDLTGHAPAHSKLAAWMQCHSRWFAEGIASAMYG